MRHVSHAKNGSPKPPATKIRPPVRSASAGARPRNAQLSMLTAAHSSSQRIGSRTIIQALKEKALPDRIRQRILQMSYMA